MTINHRHSIRLREFDYASPGAYFVTICTAHRSCLFGDIVDGAMRLSEMGTVAADEWLKTPIIRPEIELDEWVIMPNHVHGISGRLWPDSNPSSPGASTNCPGNGGRYGNEIIGIRIAYHDGDFEDAYSSKAGILTFCCAIRSPTPRHRLGPSCGSNYV